MIEFDCPACDATIRVGDNAIGKKGRCPKCQTLLLVPDPDDFEDDEEEPAPESTSEPDANAEPEATAEPEPQPVPPLQPTPQPTLQPTPESKPEPEPEPVFTPPEDAEPALIVDEPAEPAASTATAPPASESSSDEPATVEPFPPREIDPDNPFAFAAAPTGVSHATSYRRRSRRKSSMSTRQIGSIVAAVLGLAILLLGGWLMYAMVSPDLTGDLTGERFRSVELPSVSFSGPGEDVPSGDVSTVMNVLENEGVPLRSEYISVMLDANSGKPRVSVAPGPQSIPVRVALGDQDGVQAVLARQREHITKLKQRELRTATANLFRDYAAYLDSGTAMSKLPEYRDKVALNAAIGPVGFAIEAVIRGVPFPCVYEDGDGNCYFFLPEGLRTFQLRGRKLADGSTPLPVEFNVTLVDAKSPVIAGPGTGDAESNPEQNAGDEDKADEDKTAKDEPSKDVPKSEGAPKSKTAEPEESADKPAGKE